MTEKEIKISYEEYRCPEEMLPEDRELVCEAMEAMNGAYAPYSRYHVGAAVRMSNGQIVRGANQETRRFLQDCALKGPQCLPQAPGIPTRKCSR